MLALIDNPKLFIILVFPQLAHLSLVLGEQFVLKDLPFYEVVHLAYFKACQARLEKRERKRQEWTLRQTLAAGHPSSSSVVRFPTQKKKKLAARQIRRVRTPFSPFSSFLSVSSSSSSSDEPEVGVDQLVPPIICEENEEDDDMTSNLRAGFCERHHKRISESIIVSPTIQRKFAWNLSQHLRSC